MFDFFKNLLRKPAERPEESLPTTQAAPAAPPPPAFNGRGNGTGNGSRPAAPGQRPGALLQGKGIELGLEGILAHLPLELQPRIKQGQVGNRTITVPMEK